MIDVLFPHFPYVYVHLHLLFCFKISFFLKMTWVLSIANCVASPFQKVCANCHVANVITSPMGGVRCNVCHSKSTVKKLGFLHGSITTNDEPVLLTIEGK
jgi:hypothetical protein